MGLIIFRIGFPTDVNAHPPADFADGSIGFAAGGVDDVIGERGALEVINHCPGVAIGGDKIHYPGVGARGPIFRLEFAGSGQQAVAGNRAEKRPGGKANGAASGEINAELAQGDGRRQQPGTVSNRPRTMVSANFSAPF